MDIHLDGHDFDVIVEQHIRYLIEQKVHTILQHQLKDIVEGKLAALRLSDPNCPSIEARIQQYLDDRMRNSIK